MKSLKELEKDIELIKARNRKVEADKAWELSTTRTMFISAVTFGLLYAFFRLINSEPAFLNAFISVAAYLLSTLSYGILKSWWLRKQ